MKAESDKIWKLYLESNMSLKDIILSANTVDEAEDAISKNAEYSYKYARDVLKGKRFEKGEDAISKNDEYSYLYAKNVLK